MTQGSLFATARLQEQFEEYHGLHPEVFGHLVALARKMRDRGFRHYSVKTLWEVLRWHFDIEKGDNDFKLNNNFHSRYARKIMADFPDEFAGFFELRDLRS